MYAKVEQIAALVNMCLEHFILKHIAFVQCKKRSEFCSYTVFARAARLVY